MAIACPIPPSTAVSVLLLGLSLGVSLHVLLYKRETRTAAAWIFLVGIAPLLGAFLYAMLGINRVKRKASQLVALGLSATDLRLGDSRTRRSQFEDHSDVIPSLVNVSDLVNPWRLLNGNRVTPLFGGDEAYPQMLAAVRGAQRSVALGSYIFDTDAVGEMFAVALAEATRRGVETRVLIDDVGSLYSFPPMDRRLRRLGVRVAKFLPAWLPWHAHFWNLRNHRKLLVVDGVQAFMGGMNIREGHWLSRRPRKPVADIQFHVRGPVVQQLQEVFAEDWAFTTGESLQGERWFPVPEAIAGASCARALPDGPDKAEERTKWLILGALASAQKSVKILTPYFSPEPEVLSALNTAALRGVTVDLVIPEKTNIFWCTWATQAVLWEIAEKGVRIWLSPAPFTHSKTMTVDGKWSLVGSSNWDVRSLRLNFELNLECYSEELTAKLDAHVERQMARSRRLREEEIRNRPLSLRLRDGVARLYTPVL